MTNQKITIQIEWNEKELSVVSTSLVDGKPASESFNYSFTNPPPEGSSHLNELLKSILTPNSFIQP